MYIRVKLVLIIEDEMIKVCEYCGIEYTPKNRGARGKRQIFCSIKCYREYNKGINHPMYGKHHSEESILKMRNSHKGIISPMKGKHHTGESIEKIRLSQLGKHYSPKTEFKKGHQMTNDVILKIKDSMKTKNHGEDNPNWKGGISFLPYCFKFNNELKEIIRQRDDHICQLCNKTQDGERRKLSVHHIHYDKENCEPDLITLCRSCNIKVNTAREYYEGLFMNKLNERELLFWTRGRLL